MTVTAPERADHVPGQDVTGPGPARGPLPAWRRWRAPAAVALVVLLGGLIVALLQVPAPVTGPLDPDDTGPAGAHAVVALLRSRGQTVIRAGSATAAAVRRRPHRAHPASGQPAARSARPPRARRPGPRGDAGPAGAGP